MNALLPDPVTIIVTATPAERVPPDYAGDPSIIAMINLTHRMACEAAQLFACSPWLAGCEKPTAWRDCMSDETRRAVEALEASGAMKFVHESEVGNE